MRFEDARAVTDLIAAQEVADVGEQVVELADVEADWSRPSHDLAASAVGVLDGERLVGYAEVTGGDRGDACVHPDELGRGIGTWLAGWLQDRARRLGATEIGMPVPQGSPGDRLLTALGWRVRWTSWVLQLPPGREVAAPTLPAGHAVREARPDDHRAAHEVVEDAFLEWSRRDRQDFADWSATTVGRPGFEPWCLRVVTDAAGVVVGAVHVVLSGEGAERTGFVDKLAVRADRRGLGFGQALLADAFAAARAHGATRSELSTDSRTGALGLYQRVGMEVTPTWLNRGVAL
nr:GNAT family N-acetyltransferase [Nocardioides perillae]